MHKKSTLKYKTILVPRFDGLGDLVLLSGMLQAIRALLPKVTLIILVKHCHVELARLLAPNLHILTTNLNPYIQGREDFTASTFFAPFDSLKPDLLLLTAYNSTWLDLVIAAHFTDKTEIAGFHQNASKRPDFKKEANQLNALFNNFVEVDSKIPEIKKYEKLFRHIFSSPNYRLPTPKLSLPDNFRSIPNKLAVSFNFDTGYIICAPAGTRNVRIKSWPSKKYAVAIKHLLNLEIPILLVGHKDEEHEIKSLFNSIQPSKTKCTIWIGKDNDLSTLIRLAAKSRLYFGNDTGLMHICSALKVPVIALFGGGTWPRFVPSGPGIALAMPMPCFFCNWDCCFSNAPCIQEIDIDPVIEALDNFLLKSNNNSKKECTIRTIRYNPATIINTMVSGFRIRKNHDSRFAENMRSKLSQWDKELSLKHENLQQWQSKLDKRASDLNSHDLELHKLEQSLKQLSRKSKIIDRYEKSFFGRILLWCTTRINF